MPKARRIWKVTKWFLMMLVVLVIVFFVTIMPWAVATITTTNRFHFPDPNDGKQPADFGLHSESVEFHSSDGIDLKGWWLPAMPHGSGAAGTIIYVHGQNRSRAEMMPMAQYGHALGYNGLVFDLRHHGASSGQVSSVGYWERLDVEAAVRYALSRPDGTRPMVLWGISLGAAASLLAAAETPDVGAVISDSSFLSFEDTARHHWKLFFPTFPSFPMYNETIWLITRRAHFNPADFDLRKAVEQISPRPMLFVGVEGDRRMPPDIARALYSTASSPDKMVLIVPGTRHGEGFSSGNEQYKQVVKEFLEKAKGPLTP